MVVCLVLVPLGIAPLGLLGISIGWMLDVAEWIAAWPAASLHILPMPVWGVTLVSFGGIWWLLWRQRWRWLGAPLIIAAGTIIVLRERKLARRKTVGGT